MAAQALDLRPQAVLCDAAVLAVPLTPFLPLVAAHPAVHQWDTHLVSHLDDAIAGELTLQANHVEPEVFHVAEDRGVAVGVVRVQQVRCVRRAADEEILAVDLQVEVSALAEFGELLVGVAELLNGADAEPQMAWNIAVGMRRPDKPLREAIDAAIEKLVGDGTMASIYGRYGVTLAPPKD